MHLFVNNQCKPYFFVEILHSNLSFENWKLMIVKFSYALHVTKCANDVDQAHLFTYSFLATVKSNEDCFQLGLCRNGYWLDFKPALDEFECLDLCKALPRCGWATYYPYAKSCTLFETCPYLDTEECIDCVTAEKDCVPDEPICWIDGACEGTAFSTVSIPSAKECYQACNSAPECRWFTFHGATSECDLFVICPTIDTSCEECISGERRCIAEWFSRPTFCWT